MLKQYFNKYFADDFSIEITKEIKSNIIEGQMTPLPSRNKTGPGETDAAKPVAIRNSIARFVDSSNYADSFGFQWNTFKSTQLDQNNGQTHSRDRFFTYTKWKPEDLKNKSVLEVGCGAGRFTQILLDCGADLVSVDYSTAVDACVTNHQGRQFLAIQGDLFKLPFKKNTFDFVFCYGVLQHTPDPIEGFAELTTFLKPGAKISIDNYVNRLFSPWCTPKYLWRPFTRRMNRDLLLKIIRFYIPLYLPFDTLIRKIPRIGTRILSMIPIPCWNYIDQGMSYRQRKEWAILDTFDALATYYDNPKEISDYASICSELGLKNTEIFYGSTGLVVNAQK